MSLKHCPVIEFDVYDLHMIATHADRLILTNIVRGSSSGKYNRDKSDFEVHYVGIMGEQAVHKFTGAKVDTEIQKVGGDGGIDMKVFGHDCQIKTFDYSGPNLDFFIDDMSCFTAPVCIGCQILSPLKVRILGCISRSKFEAQATKRNFGYGDRLRFPAAQLSPLDVLKTALSAEAHPKHDHDDWLRAYGDV